MNTAERLAVRSACYSVASAWIGAYLDEHLFFVLSGIFIGMGLLIALDIRLGKATP